MAKRHTNILAGHPIHRILAAVLALAASFVVADLHAAMLYKNYVVRYDRGWDILCDPYEVQRGDWVLKIFRQKGEIAHEDFREFLGIFQRLNPHVKDIDRIRPGQVVDIPLKKLIQGTLPGQSSGVVTIPFVMINNPREMIQKHARSYTIQRGDTVSKLIANQFGGKYGNLTYNQGLKLFQAVNPQIKDVNRIYAGQKIYMPDPSIRQQSWYSALFDDAGDLVEEITDTEQAASQTPPAQPAAAAAPVTTPSPSPSENTGPAAEAAAAIGGNLFNKGTYFLPMPQGKDFELDLSRYPMIDMGNGSKVILTTQDKVMNVDLPLIQSYWKDVKVVKIESDASAQDILQSVLDEFADEDQGSEQLAFEDGGVMVQVRAKWIRTETSADGLTPRHTCITPIASESQRTHAAIIRYLDQNDIVINDILSGVPVQSTLRFPVNPAANAARIDGRSQKALIQSFCRHMGFSYSPNTGISFPYAGIQVQALSNLLSFGNGREILIDFGDLYGDAVAAIRQTGLDVLQIQVEAGAVEIIEKVMAAGGMAYTAAPVFYGAERPPDFNTSITVNGILIPMDNGERQLFTSTSVHELVAIFLREHGVRLVGITAADQE